MQFRNTLENYGAVAKFLHWLIAFIVIGLLILGLYMVPLPINAQKLKLYGWHKEWGILVLMLVIVRLSWRLININPALPAHMPRWQQLAAKSVHFAFYIFLFLMPLTGWMMSSSAGLPVSFFGLFTLPDLVSPNENNMKILEEVHEWLGYGLIAALLAHVGAALQHHFIYKDNILRRMLP